jgi:hypothetical protein
MPCRSRSAMADHPRDRRGQEQAADEPRRCLDCMLPDPHRRPAEPISRQLAGCFASEAEEVMFQDRPVRVSGRKLDARMVAVWTPLARRDNRQVVLRESGESKPAGRRLKGVESAARDRDLVLLAIASCPECRSNNKQHGRPCGHPIEQPPEQTPWRRIIPDARTTFPPRQNAWRF